MRVKTRPLLSSSSHLPTIHLIDYILVISSSFLIYINSLNGDFVYDDHVAIVSNPVVSSLFTSSFDASFNSLVSLDFWAQPLSHEGSHKSWRPLSTLSFAVNHFIHGMTPFGFHVVNVLIHMMCTGLFLRLSNIVIKHRVPSLISSLLFSVHAVHSESVSSIVGRADLLSSLFVFIAINNELRTKSPRDLFTSSHVYAVLALLSKETGIVLLPLLAVHRFLISHKLSSSLPFLLSSSVVLSLRLSLHSFSSPFFSPSDNPIAVHPSFLIRTLSFFVLPIRHLRLLVWPSQLCFDWSMDSIPVVSSPLDPAFLSSFVIYSLLTALIVRCIRHISKSAAPIHISECKNSALLFCLSILILPHLPSSNIFLYTGFVIAERILYLPSAGYCLLVGILIQTLLRTFPTYKSVVIAFSLSLILLMSTRLFSRNNDWRNDISLYESAVELNPAKAYANLGQALATKGLKKEAEEAYTKALQKKGCMADVHYNMGVLRGEQGDHSKALAHYYNAIRCRPYFALAHLNLGLSLKQLNRRNESLSIFHRCSTLDSSKTKRVALQISAQMSCAFNRGAMLMADGDNQEAISALLMAVSFSSVSHSVDKTVSSIYVMLAHSYAAIGMDEKAERWLEKAEYASEERTRTLFTLSFIRLRQNRTNEAWSIIKKLSNTSLQSSTLHFNLGLALEMSGNIDAARIQFQLAIKLYPEGEESYIALANLERKEGRNMDAEEVLRDYVASSPSSTSHSAFAAQLHANHKYDEAKYHYDRSLLLNPNDSITRENRERLRRSMNKTSINAIEGK